MDNLRLFLGIELSEEASRSLAERAARIRTALTFRSWTHPADYHATLHFLGDTPADRLDAIAEATGSAAAEAAPIALALTGPGTFGPADAPRVLWCGLAEPAAPGALAALHA
uniref:RNA 2',3'-cyclic phosphodiesterase n=1 Tax=Cohnella sp. REN36 TaxID=2887347 RepID=UPI001D140C99